MLLGDFLTMTYLTNKIKKISAECEKRKKLPLNSIGGEEVKDWVKNRNCFLL